MTIQELKYHRGTHDKDEHIIAAFTIGASTDRIEIYVVNLCGRHVNHYTEKGLLVIVPPDAQLEMLWFVKREREKILAQYPIKTRVGWAESGINSLMDYCNPGDAVDEAMVEYGLNVVPPITHYNDLIQVGEPYSDALDETGEYQPIYSTFGRQGSVWRYLGECFRGRTENKVKAHSSLERAIKTFSKQ